MTKSSNTLKVQSGSTVYTCDLYDTTAEAKVYGASGYLPVNVGNTNLYAPLYPATGWTQGFYDNYGTPVHVKNGSTEYILAQKSLIRLGITAVAHQTITVTPSNNSIYSSGAWTSGNRYFPYGTTWSVSHTADTGWTKGTLSPASSGTLTNANVDITATAATHNTYKITLPSTSNQTITIHYKEYNGTSWVNTTYKTTTASITLGHGSQYYLTVAASTGYNAGSISNAGSSSSPLTLTAARSVTIGAASLKSYVLTLAATSHQTLKIRYKSRAADGTMPTSWSSEISSGSEAKTYTLRHGSQYQITSLSGATGWDAGSAKNGSTVVTPSTSTTYTMTAAITVSATAADHKEYKITLTQKANETVTIHYKNHNGTSLASSWSTTTASITLGHGSQYYSTIAASAGYTAGTITSAGTASSPNTLTAAKTISFTAATAITPKITFTKTGESWSFTATYTNTSGTSTTTGSKPSSVTIKYNTAVKFTFNTSASGAYIKIYQGSTLKTTLYADSGTYQTWTSGKLTADTTFKVEGYYDN